MKNLESSCVWKWVTGRMLKFTSSQSETLDSGTEGETNLPSTKDIAAQQKGSVEVKSRVPVSTISTGISRYLAVRSKQMVDLGSAQRTGKEVLCTSQHIHMVF